MVIYTVSVTKGGSVIYSHDVSIDGSRPFSDYVQDAIETFRKNFPAISLLDDDVKLSIGRKP